LGTEANGMKRGYVITVFELGEQYVDIVASSHASAFTKNEPVLQAMAKQLVLANGPSPSPAAANPPPPNSPATNASPVKQPPQPQPPSRH
jgi:hypothetical protein